MKKVIGSIAIFSTPFLALAQNVESIGDLIGVIGGLINQLTPLLFALATIYLIWNLVKYIEAGKGDEKTRGEARDSIILAVVLLFVMVSIWGLVGVLKGTFDVGEAGPDIPTPFQPAS